MQRSKCTLIEGTLIVKELFYLETCFPLTCLRFWVFILCTVVCLFLLFKPHKPPTLSLISDIKPHSSEPGGLAFDEWQAVVVFFVLFLGNALSFF